MELNADSADPSEQPQSRIRPSTNSLTSSSSLSPPPSPTSRLMVDGEDSSYLRPIPEDDDDEDEDKSSPRNSKNNNKKKVTDPHIPTSTSLSLLDSANPFLLAGLSTAAAAAPGPMAGTAAGATASHPYLPQHRQYDVSSDDARSSTKGIIVDPRSKGDDDDNERGAGGNRSNESVVGTDRAEVAYANDDSQQRISNTSTGRQVTSSLYPAPAPGYRSHQVPPEQQQRHNPPIPASGVRGHLNRRHSQMHERWKGLSKRNQGILVGSVCLTVLVVVAIVLVIVFTTDGGLTGSSGSGGGTGSSPSMAPSSLGSISPSTAAYLDDVLRNVSSPQAFADPSSPQSLARDWLYNDLLLNDAVDDGQERVIQRYVCVELVYALNIPTTRLQSDKVECNWTGFSCDQDYRGHIITSISFPSMNLTGTLPSELTQLPYLQRLELNNNSLTGSIPEAWMDNATKMQNLYRLDLSANNLTGTLPSYFWTSFPPLSYVYLNDNQFSGPLQAPDASSSTLDLMEEVWLQRNRFSGSLPAQWMLTRFPNLEKLKLGGNRFTGTLPTPVLSSATTSLGDNEVIWPANMSHYDVSANQLLGTIPVALFYSFSNLQVLYLHTNSFTGTLPSSTDPSITASATTMELSRVLMHSNFLQGSIPSDFGSTWTNLSVLTLHNNSLTGTISPAGQCSFWPNLTEVWADCPYQVDCSCPECNCSSYAR